MLLTPSHTHAHVHSRCWPPLLQPIRVIYVDNAAQTYRIWQKIIATDQPGGVMVKQDAYHLKRRFTSAVPRTHRLYKAFCSELSDVLLPVYAGEHERLGPMDPKAFRRKARKHIPPGTGQLVLGGVAALLQKYRAAPGGETFITADVLKVLENQQALVGPGLDLISGKFGMSMSTLRAEGDMLLVLGCCHACTIWREFCTISWPGKGLTRVVLA